MRAAYYKVRKRLGYVDCAAGSARSAPRPPRSYGLRQHQRDFRLAHHHRRPASAPTRQGRCWLPNTAPPAASPSTALQQSLLARLRKQQLPRRVQLRARRATFRTSDGVQHDNRCRTPIEAGPGTTKGQWTSPLFGSLEWRCIGPHHPAAALASRRPAIRPSRAPSTSARARQCGRTAEPWLALVGDVLETASSRQPPSAHLAGLGTLIERALRRQHRRGVHSQQRQPR
jgi:hypothetical protein